MKVAVVSTHVLWATHYGTELEIMQNHLDAGHEVVHITCNGALERCDTNITYKKDTCFSCINRRLIGKKMLEQPVRTVPLDLGPTPALDFAWTTEAELKRITYKSFDLGLAVLSSVISGSRSTDLGPAEVARVQVLLRKGAALYDWMLRFIEREKPDRVYVFNGRFTYNRAILRACQATGTQVQVHERGNSIYHYELFPNTLPHDLDYIQQRIETVWAQSELSESEKEGIGSSFYEERRKGVEQSWFSFIAQQQAGRMPAGWNPAQRNVVFFNSSEDEFAAVGDQWKRFVYPSQVAAIRAICRQFADRPEFSFYLRVHPNLQHVRDRALEELIQEQVPNLTVVYPGGAESTYQMMDQAEKVITFGSSAGIEAVYAGVPSILLGSCFYMNLGGNYVPANEAELFQLVAARCEAKPKAAALRYGFYYKTFGIPFQHVTPDGIVKATFKGRALHQTNESPLLMKLARRMPGKHVRAVWLNKLLNR